MINISVTVSLGTVGNQLVALADAIGRPGEINRKVGIELYGWTLRDFNAAGVSQTPPWSPLAASTLAQKVRLGFSSRPLVRTGNLRQSLAPVSTDEYGGVGARASFGVDYAAVHETGSQSHPGHPPQRKILPTEQVALDLARRVWESELQRVGRELIK